jgi:hypothetical protein
MGDDDNPFKLPPDDQIFLIREQERQKHLEERKRVKSLKVWQKHTSSSRVVKGRPFKDSADDMDIVAAAASTRKMRRSVSDTVVRDARREKENILDFVHKKREMFLVQMSLDVQNAEIKKLDEKVKQKDEALKKSQQMLDEDVSRFDTFLQNNDQKAHKAMKDAEEETKKKQDRLQRIKQLKSGLSAVQSEIAKHREQREECMKYKSFLEKLTPQDWKQLKAEEKVQRKRDRRRRYIDGKMNEAKRSMDAEIVAEKDALEARAQAAPGRRRNRREQEEAARAMEEELERRKVKIKAKYPTEDVIADGYESVSSGEEMPLFFKDKDMLLEVFISLEEQNLFLIQTSQDKEQTLEDWSQKLSQKKKQMGALIQKLEANVEELEGHIKTEQEQAEKFKQASLKTSNSSERDSLIDDLTKKIIEVHQEADPEAKTEADPEPKQMLKAIEFKLEEYLTLLDEEEEEVPQAVSDKLHSFEKKRRAFVKSERKKTMDAKIQERLDNSLVRSQLPIHKKVGKQVMFRSPPLFQARKIVQHDEFLEQAIQEHNVFGVYINRKDDMPYPDAPKREEDMLS